jgi:hypothetical protein
LKKKGSIPKVVLYRHPHHIEKQQSSRQGHEHQHTFYGPTWHQKGNKSRGAWRNTNTAGRYQDRETTPWHQRHDKDQDQGDKETVGHHVHLPLGWMDACTWYQLATLLSDHIVWFLLMFRGQNM